MPEIHRAISNFGVVMKITRAFSPVLALAAAALVAASDSAFAGITVVPVPEPGTLALLVGGAVGVLVLRRKLRK